MTDLQLTANRCGPRKGIVVSDEDLGEVGSWGPGDSRG